ncbi:MAG: two-component regulator propeller domain-containing protein [Candidatus Cryptobacteroides sp.]
MKRVFSSIILFLAIITAVAAGEIRFEKMAEGMLPTSEVSRLYQDSEGYLWIVTYYGLIRYDGYEYLNFSLPPYCNEPFDGCLHTICEGNDGNLYIGTERGLFVLDKSTMTMRKIRDFYAENLNIVDIVRDSLGRLWISSGSGLFRMDIAGNIQRIDFQRDTAGGDMLGAINLMIDPDNNLWVTTWEDGLYRYDLSTGKIHHYSSGALKYSYALFIDHEDTMWIGTWGRGLLNIDRKQLIAGKETSYVQYVHDSGDSRSIMDNIIYDIEEDGDGTIYVGGRSGLSILDRSKSGGFLNIYPGRDEASIPFNEVNTLLRTRDESILIGTMGGGLCRLDTPSRTGIEFIGMDSVRKLYQTSSVRSIYAENENELWLSLYGYGLVKYDRSNDNVLNCRNLECFKDCREVTFVQDIMPSLDNGELCLATFDNGLWLFNPQMNTASVLNSTTRAGLLSDCIIAMEEDAVGNVFLGTDRGVFVMDTTGFVCSLSSFVGFDTPDSNLQIVELSIDAEGNLWFATGSEGIGRVRLDGRDSKLYHRGSSSFERQFNTIYCDSSGNVWAGSMWRGLYRYDRLADEFVRVSALSFLADRGINNICENPEGRIWVTTTDCAAAFSVNGADAPEILMFRKMPAGGLSVGFNKNAMAPLDSAGTVAVGCTSGIAVLSCDGLEEKQSRTGITRFSVDGKEISSRTYAGRVKDNVTIRVSCFDFLRPDGAIYRYRISPINGGKSGWVTMTGDDNALELSSLKPGRYSLEICGKRSDSIAWSPVETVGLTIFGNPWLSLPVLLVFGYLLLSAVIFMAVLFFRNKFYRKKLKDFQEDREKVLDIGDIDRHIILTVKDMQYTSENCSFLSRAMDVINANIENQEFSQEDFAREMGVSKTVLMVRMKELTGMSPIRLLIDARLAAAYKIIKDSRECPRISDVAYSVGFNDAKYFSRQFKAKYGITPRTANSSRHPSHK